MLISQTSQTHCSPEQLETALRRKPRPCIHYHDKNVSGEVWRIGDTEQDPTYENVQGSCFACLSIERRGQEYKSGGTHIALEMNRGSEYSRFEETASIMQAYFLRGVWDVLLMEHTCRCMIM